VGGPHLKPFHNLLEESLEKTTATLLLRLRMNRSARGRTIATVQS
jgi:hypothetical protein